RTLVPFIAGETTTSTGTSFNSRKGYFYISNNNLADGTDDVLQFTADVRVDVRNSDQSPYYGHAVPLYSPSPPASGSPWLNFLQTPNQPDRDDGQVTVNNAGASRAAEIAYFMRGG